MKTVGILLLTTASLYCSDAQTMIDNIVSPKDTLAPAQIAGTADVFEKPPVALDGNKTIAPPRFDLTAIFENGALINGKWMKLGDSVHGYRIEKIGKDRVFLAGGKKQKTLYIFKGGK